MRLFVLYDLDTPYPERKSLRIDTSRYNPEQTTQDLIRHFSLIKLEAQSS